MRIVDAVWDTQVNKLQIDCACGSTFFVRADRWRVVCPGCGAVGGLSSLRNEYVKAKGGE